MVRLVASAPAARYSTKIIKAGALLADTKTLFAYWEPDLGVRENLERVRAENLFGKSSRSRVDDVLAIFRQRFLVDPGIANALAIMVKSGVPAQILDRVFFFHAAESDPILHDVVTEMLADRIWNGRIEVSTTDVQNFIEQQLLGSGSMNVWLNTTAHRVAQGVMATLRDFGLLAGVLRKRIVTPYLAPEAFAYVAFLLNRTIRSGDQLVNSPQWRLFFLQPDLVERLFIEAQQHHLLDYSAAGRVVRVDFPADSIEEYARALAVRTT